MKDELIDCITAWESFPSKVAWCNDNSQLVEPQQYQPSIHINYILDKTPEAEQATRLRCYRPVRVALPTELNTIIETVFKTREAELDILKNGSQVCKPGWFDAWRAKVEAQSVLHNYILANKPNLTKLLYEDWPDSLWTVRDQKNTNITIARLSSNIQLN